MPPEWENSPEWRRYVHSAIEDMLPKLRGSAFALMLVPGETDVKFATELGFSIMLDKPIIALVTPDSHPSEHMMRVADEIVEGDFATEAARVSTQERLSQAMDRLGERFG